jgi:hypothetical protein
LGKSKHRQRGLLRLNKYDGDGCINQPFFHDWHEKQVTATWFADVFAAIIWQWMD